MRILTITSSTLCFNHVTLSYFLIYLIEHIEPFGYLAMDYRGADYNTVDA